MRKTGLIAIVMIMQLATGISQTLTNRSAEDLRMILPEVKPDTNKLNVFLQLSRSYLPGEKNTRPDLDSALKYAQQAAALSKLLKNKLREADSYLLMSQISALRQECEQGRSFAQKAILIYNKLGPEKKLAESYVALSDNIEIYDSGIVEIIRLSELAVTIFRKENDKKSEATALKKWGEMLTYQGKLDDALKKLKQSLTIYKTLGYEQVQEIYSLIGATYNQSGNYNEALKYGLLAIKTAESLKDTSQQVAMIYTYLAVTYGKLNQLEYALEIVKKALTIAKKGNDLPVVIMLACNIAHINLILNRPKEAIAYLTATVKNYPDIKDRFALAQINSNFLQTYLQLKDYRNAGIYCAKLLTLSDQYSPNDLDQLVVYPFVCKYFIATHQYKKASKYLPLYKEICEKSNLVSDLKVVHLLGFELDSAQGKYLSAIAHYRLFRQLNDTLTSEAKSKQISQLQIQYETEKKDKDIQLLTEQGLMQKSQLQQASFLRNVTFAGVALLLIIVGLMYNGYRLKQRANDQLRIQQEEIDHKNSSLQHLLSEKEWLLKEVHHRVKNNLQTVMSLLSSQSAYLHNDAALLAIKDSQHRVQAMSLIHQKLYNSENFSSIDMPAYIGELIEYMRDCFSTGQRIRFDLDIDPLELDVSQAVPVGLILNEAITNAIKYAFPENREGMISVTLQSAENDQCLLMISDNGIGMPENFNTTRPGSLGLSLIKGLSQDLDGTFTLENDNGTVLKITFVVDTSIKRIANFTSVSETLV